MVTDSATIHYDESLNFQMAKVRCTWAAGYTEPKVEKGLRVISFSPHNALCGRLTGNRVTVGTDKIVWVEVVPEIQNRRKEIWMRVNDINIPIADDGTGTGTGGDSKTKSTGWIKWLLGGLSLLSLLK